MHRAWLTILTLTLAAGALGCGDDAGGGASPEDGGSAGMGGDDGSMPQPDGGGTGGAAGLQDAGVDAGADAAVQANAELGGVGQKGPFEQGASVDAYALASDGSRTDDSVSATTDAQGRYDLPEASWAGPTEVEVSGTYYDEVAGSFTTEPRTLMAVVSASGATAANVNLFTHFAAARIKHRMSEGDAYADAETPARADMEAVFGITNDSETLDLLEAGTSREDDNGSLLAFSAALIKEGLAQTAIDAIAADFADDGRINGDGESHFDAVVERATDEGAQLIADAKANLESQYGGSTPSSGGNIGWTPTGCWGKAFFERDVLCDGQYHEDQFDAGETKHYRLYPDIPGSFAWHVYFDDNDCATRTVRIYGDWDDATDTGSNEINAQARNDSFSYTEGFTVMSLSRERYYHVTLHNSCDAASDFSIELYRISEGTKGDPVVLDLDEPHDGIAGRWLSTGNGYNYTSFYRVVGQPEVVELSNIGPSGDIYLKAYAGPEDDPFSTFNGTSIDSSTEAPHEIMPTVDPSSGDVLYVTVENRGSMTTATAPPPTGRSYDITALSSAN